jgi:metal-sulfur cluster biosynthetic enzyme
VTTVTAAAFVDRGEVERMLNEIVDPCSIASGCPAGLVDMGLVRDVRISGPAHATTISVTLTVTHPFCMMSAVFVNEARIRLGELAAVEAVDVELDTSVLWTDDDLRPEYAERRRRSLAERGIVALATEERTHA